MLPKINIGLTIAEYPNFFVFFPATEAKTSELLLVDEASNIVYKTKLIVPDTNGIIKINLPDDRSIPRLAVGKKYQWHVAIVDDFGINPHLYTSGWVKRIEVLHSGE